jgi:seryl-tRNA synthetase
MRGTKVAGHRGYFLKGAGALLNLALLNYGVKFLASKEYTPIQPPFFMKKSIMLETCQLSDIDENMYKCEPHNKGDEDMYLIATSEQPLTGYFRGEWLDTKELPIKFAGMSSCFRKESGSHGKQTWGTFRVHQFEKVEQLCVTSPEESWKVFDDMLKYSEEFYQSLKLPYRVVSIVGGALNDAAAKKYDLEAWFPGYNDYMELVSCSNCTDYQSRALEVRYGNKKGTDKEKKYVHMLNGTLVATERTMCCILENYQEENGVRVPEVLVPFVGTDFLPYKKPMPKAKDFGAAPEETKEDK